MLRVNDKHDLWCEKYRPQVIEDCILPKELKDTLSAYVKDGSMKSALFHGSAGQGKTTAARCIANELGADFMVINASMDNGIDEVRNQISKFASTISFSDSKKITLLDEGDYLSNNAQAALRGFMEQYAGNHALIITCNFKTRIIEPIHSRCAVFDFRIPKAEKATLAAQFFKRACAILDNEKVEFDKKVVAEIINKFFPDFRRCLNELQRYSASGKIDSGILANHTDDSIKTLFTALKAKKFNDMRKFVAAGELDAAQFYRAIYDSAEQYMEVKSLPQLIMLIGQYQYQAAFCADQEINTAAFCTELMLSDVSWK